MSRSRVTKAEILLRGAEFRLRNAAADRDKAQRALDQAQARYEAHRDAFDELEIALRPTPKKSSTTAPPAARKSSPSATKGKSLASTEAATENALFASKEVGVNSV